MKELTTSQKRLWLSGVLLFVSVQVSADYKAHILGNMTISVTGKTKKLSVKTSDQLNLKAGDEICITKGRGHILVEGGNTGISLISEAPNKSKNCLTLPAIKKESNRPKISNWFINKYERSESGQARGDEKSNNPYTRDIYPNSQGWLNITSQTWKTDDSRLPYIIQFISPDKKIVAQFESNHKDVISFVFPKRFLADKEEYLIKVTNKRGDVLVGSNFYFTKN